MTKKITKKVYGVVAGILALSLSVTTACFYKFSKADKDTKTSGGNEKYESVERDTFISVDSGGVLKIDRSEKEEVCMGKEDTWTLFIYMTGSNLESQYENATKDIDEMFRGRINKENMDKVNIIIQTGGSTRWHSNNISNQRVQRYKVNIEDNKLELLEECGNINMGEASTLYSFLDWGVTNYAAEHMGVIMWNHGSGVVGGLCNDEKFDNESLSVHELEYCFAKLDEKMTSKFEMIGFDTCLSGSLEYANLLAPYAKYMVASADLEPGEGWYYTPIVDSLIANPDITGADLGKVICENYGLYYDIMYKGSDRTVNYTLATYDLSKVDKVCIETNYLTKYLYDQIQANAQNYWSLEAFRATRLRYNKSNLDIGSILDYFDTSSKFNYNTTYYKQAVDEMIIHSVICDNYKEMKAKGITLYIPNSVVTVKELNDYRNVCFSPYWLKYIEWMNTRTITEDMSKFKTTSWESSKYFFEENFDFMNYDISDDIKVNINEMAKNMLIVNSNYSSDGFAENWYHNTTYGVDNTASSFVPFEMMRGGKVLVDEGNMSAKVDEKEIASIDTVYNTIFANINDETVCLGQNNMIDYDKETGEINSTFDGQWFMLPDGQLLTAYIISSKDNVTEYAFPVMIGDVESSIRVEEVIDNNGKATYTTLGVWDYVENDYSNNSGRGYLPLEAGTTITPIYDVFNFEDNTYETEYGEDYTISGDFEFLYTELEEKEYSYAFEIEQFNEVSVFVQVKDNLSIFE